MKNPNLMTEAEQIKFVKKIWYNIRHINNPSEAVQMTAVQQNSHAIEYIKAPTRKVIYKAIKQGFVEAILLLGELTDEEKYELIQLNPEVIYYLDSPTEEMINYSKLVM